MKRAACLFVQRTDGKILVLDRFNKGEFGLPGGSCNEGEFSIEAAIRETFEETGLNLLSCIDDVIQVYAERRISGTYSETFFLNLPNKFFDTKLISSDEGTASWRLKEDILNGPYAYYNSRLLEVLHTLNYLK